MEYEDMPRRASKRSDLRVISEMKTARILSFLMHRHRVGLLGFSTIMLSSYVAYDKFLHIFF